MTLDIDVQHELKGVARKFQAGKRIRPVQMVDMVVEAMTPIGGITGLRVAANQTMTLHNHGGSYTLPIRYEEHRQGALSAFGRRAYAFLEELRDHLVDAGVSPRNIEYHMGPNYSSKHHCPA